MVGDLSNFGEVWYNEKSLANILSMAAVRKRNRITMDTDIEAALFVHRHNGTIMKFQEYRTGLYYFDASASKITNTSVADYFFVQTVSSNRRMFHRREIEGADKARDLYTKLGRPSQQHFEYILANSLITNCPVTADDAKRALIIYGPDPATLKGKMTKHKGQHVPTFSPVSVPQFVLDHHKRITICEDFFFVQGIPFLHTISRKLQFRTVTQVVNRTKATMLKETRKIVQLYEQRGFEIMDIHADHEFACIRDDIAPIILDTVPADEHVGEIERSIRTTKERVRCTIHGLPYRRYTKVMIIDLVHTSVHSLNQIPAKDGISNRISPLTLVTGKGNVDYNKLKLCFGSYVQVFEDNAITNTAAPRRAVSYTHLTLPTNREV